MYDPLDVCIACLLVFILLVLIGIDGKLRCIKEMLENESNQ